MSAAFGKFIGMKSRPRYWIARSAAIVDSGQIRVSRPSARGATARMNNRVILQCYFLNRRPYKLPFHCRHLLTLADIRDQPGALPGLFAWWPVLESARGPFRQYGDRSWRRSIRPMRLMVRFNLGGGSFWKTSKIAPQDYGLNLGPFR
jgi:hypothetical protein